MTSSLPRQAKNVARSSEVHIFDARGRSVAIVTSDKDDAELIVQTVNQLGIGDPAIMVG